MSPAPDRDSRRTKKNENEKVELPVPKEVPGTLGPNPPPGLFGPAVPEVKPKKLFLDPDDGSSEETKDESKEDVQMSEEPGKEGGAAAPKKRPG
eukprot:6502519-Karenia_brevis.AAC.1